MKTKKLSKSKKILLISSSFLISATLLGSGLSFLSHQKMHNTNKINSLNLNKKNESILSSLNNKSNFNTSNSSNSTSLLSNKFIFDDDTLNAWNNLTNDTFTSNESNYNLDNTYHISNYTNVATNGTSNISQYASWFYAYLKSTNVTTPSSITASDISSNFSSLNALLNDHFLVSNPSINATSNANYDDGSMAFSTNKAQNNPSFNLQVNPYFINGLYNISQIFSTFSLFAKTIIGTSSYTSGSQTIPQGSYGYPQFGSYFSLYNSNDSANSSNSLIPLSVIKANWNYLFCLIASGCLENSTNLSPSNQFQAIIKAINGYTIADNNNLQSIRSASAGNSANIDGQYFCPADLVPIFENLNIVIPINLLPASVVSTLSKNMNLDFSTSNISYLPLWTFLAYGYNWLGYTLQSNGSLKVPLFNLYFNDYTDSNKTSSYFTTTNAQYSQDWASLLTTTLNNASASSLSSTNESTLDLSNYGNNALYFSHYFSNFYNNDSYYTFSIGTGSSVSIITPRWLNNILNYSINPLTLSLFDNLDISHLNCFFNFSYITQSTSILDYKVAETNTPSNTYTLGVSLSDLIFYPNASMTSFETAFNNNETLSSQLSKNSYNYMESLSLNYSYWTYNTNMSVINKQAQVGCNWYTCSGDQWSFLSGDYTNSGTSSNVNNSLGGNGWILGDSVSGTGTYDFEPTLFNPYFVNDISAFSTSSSYSGIETNVTISNIKNYTSQYGGSVTNSLYFYNYNSTNLQNTSSSSNNLTVALNDGWWDFGNATSSISGMETNNNEQNSASIWANVSKNLNNTNVINVTYSNYNDIPSNLDLSNLAYFENHYDVNYLLSNPSNISTYLTNNTLTTYKTSILNYTYGSYNSLTYGSSSITNNITYQTSPSIKYPYFQNTSANAYNLYWPSDSSTSYLFTPSITLAKGDTISSASYTYGGKTSAITISNNKLDPFTITYPSSSKAGASVTLTVNITITNSAGISKMYPSIITIYLSTPLASSLISNTYNTYLITSLTTPLTTFINSIFSQKSNNVSTLNALSSSSSFSTNSDIESQVLNNNPNSSSNSDGYYYTINTIFSNRYNLDENGSYSIVPQTYGNSTISYDLDSLMGGSVSIEPVYNDTDLTTAQQTTLTNYFIAHNYNTGSNAYLTTNLNNGIFVALVNFSNFNDIINGQEQTQSSVFYLYNMTYSASGSINNNLTNSADLSISNNKITMNLSLIPSFASYEYSSPDVILSSSIIDNTLVNNNIVSKNALYSILTSLINNNALTQNYNFTNLSSLINDGYITTNDISLTNNTITFNLVLPTISYPTITNTNNNNTVQVSINGFNTKTIASGNSNGLSNNLKQHKDQVQTANTLMHNSLIIGLGVGVPVGVIVLIFIIILIVLASKGKLRNWKFVRNKRLK